MQDPGPLFVQPPDNHGAREVVVVAEPESALLHATTVNAGKDKDVRSLISVLRQYDATLVAYFGGALNQIRRPEFRSEGLMAPTLQVYFPVDAADDKLDALAGAALRSAEAPFLPGE